MMSAIEKPTVAVPKTAAIPAVLLLPLLLRLVITLGMIKAKARKPSKTLIRAIPIICAQLISQLALPISAAKVAADGFVNILQYWAGNCLMASPSGSGDERIS
jgi:hypothetical protein